MTAVEHHNDAASAPAALEVRGLSVSAGGRRRDRRQLLDGVSFRVMPGESLGIVGESGSGKSLTSLSILQLLPRGLRIDAGEVLLNSTDLLRMSGREMRSMRGRVISMVLQDPMSSLDPCFQIRSQMREVLRTPSADDEADRQIDEISETLLSRVRMPEPKEVLRRYPHELSGGMRQRVVSAIALARSPDVLIADEPTTALDVTTQAFYLSMLKRVQRATGFSLIFISHDLLLVKHLCDRLVVMYAGQVVEEGPLNEVLARPRHPYTRALLESIPKPEVDAELRPIEGYPPDPAAYPPGCRFAPRCRYARDVCSSRVPDATPRSDSGHAARCFGTEHGGWIA
jgi:oligopeptide/dipeptide ABC transporter ATP-binding protein